MAVAEVARPLGLPWSSGSSAVTDLCEVHSPHCPWYRDPPQKCLENRQLTWARAAVWGVIAKRNG